MRWALDMSALSGRARRDIYATAMKPENKIVHRRLSELKSDNGHIVIRVGPGGSEIPIVILDNANE
jgi:hypothetical protein